MENQTENQESKVEIEIKPIHSQTIGEIIKALVNFHTKAQNPKKSADNKFFQSKYARLEDVIESIRSPLNESELSIVQSVLGQDLVTILAHASGEWFRSYYPIRPAKSNDPQSFGSAISYARRYSLLSILNLAAEDDDANLAAGKHVDSSQPRNRTTTPEAPRANWNEQVTKAKTPPPPLKNYAPKGGGPLA